MDASTVVKLICEVGFPIFCCLVMGWYVNKTNAEHRAEVANLNQLHKEEVSEIINTHAEQTKEIVTAVQNNTIAVRELTAKLDVRGN